MEKWVKRSVFGAITLGLIGYCGAGLYLWAQQDNLVYPGGTVSVETLGQPDENTLSGFTFVTLKTPDGEKLVGWWHPPTGDEGVVLYLHGNSGNIGRGTRATRLRDIAATGLGVLGIEYRGFGGSTGHPSERGLVTDADTAYDYILAHAPGAKIVLFGESLGTGVAVATATRHPAAGVMLDSPFSSVASVAEHQYPFFPVGLLLRDHWDSASRIKQIKSPLLIVHCDADREVPIKEGETLFAAAADPKKLIELHGCQHIQIWNDDVRTTVLQNFQHWTAP